VCYKEKGLNKFSERVPVPGDSNETPRRAILQPREISTTKRKVIHRELLSEINVQKENTAMLELVLEDTKKQVECALTWINLQLHVSVSAASSIQEAYVRENRTVQATYLENQQLRTVQSLLTNAARIKGAKLQKQVIDLQHQHSQENDKLRCIQEHETAICEERHSKSINVIQEAQAQAFDLLNKYHAQAM
jgi:hypothetical protein